MFFCLALLYGTDSVSLDFDHSLQQNTFGDANLMLPIKANPVQFLSQGLYSTETKYNLRGELSSESDATTHSYIVLPKGAGRCATQKPMIRSFHECEAAARFVGFNFLTTRQTNTWKQPCGCQFNTDTNTLQFNKFQHPCYCYDQNCKEGVNPTQHMNKQNQEAEAYIPICKTGCHIEQCSYDAPRDPDEQGRLDRPDDNNITANFLSSTSGSGCCWAINSCGGYQLHFNGEACPDGSSCSILNKHCIAPKGVGGRCHSDLDCIGSFFCHVDGKCSDGLVVGEACQTTAEVKLHIDNGQIVEYVPERYRGQCRSSRCIIVDTHNYYAELSSITLASSSSYAVFPIPSRQSVLSTNYEQNLGWLIGRCYGNFHGGEACIPGKSQCSPDPAHYPPEEREFISNPFNTPQCIPKALSIYTRDHDGYHHTKEPTPSPTRRPTRSWEMQERAPLRPTPSPTPHPTIPYEYLCERLHNEGEKCSDDTQCRTTVTYSFDDSPHCYFFPENCGYTISFAPLVCFDDPNAIFPEDFGRCVPPRRIRETCEETSDCEDGLICYENYCYSTNLNRYCNDNYECNPLSQFCFLENHAILRKCVPPRNIKESCTHTNQCIEGLFCFKLDNDPHDNTCRGPRKRGETCADDSECGTMKCIKLAGSVNKKCTKLGMTPDSVVRLLQWYVKHQIQDSPQYCYRPPPVGKTCGDDQVQFGLSCYEECQNGYYGVGPLCVAYGLALPYERIILPPHHEIWSCPPSYYPHPIIPYICPHDCPSTQPYRCAAGCAKNAHECASTTFDMVTAAVSFLATPFTMGASKGIQVLGKFKTFAKNKKFQALIKKMDGPSDPKLKEKMNEMRADRKEGAENIVDIVGGAKAAYIKAIDDLKKEGPSCCFSETFIDLLTKAGCTNDNPLNPNCIDTLIENFANEKLKSQLTDELGFDYEMANNINSIFTADVGVQFAYASTLDPTGIIGVVGSFTKPQCIYLDTNLRPLIHLWKDVPHLE